MSTKFTKPGAAYQRPGSSTLHWAGRVSAAVCVVLTALAIAVAYTASAKPEAPAAPPMPDLKAGEAKFLHNCCACHNQWKKVGPSLVDDMAYFVRAGVPGFAVGSLLRHPVRQRPAGSAMPVFTPDMLSDKDLDDIGFYLASFTPAPASPPALGSAARGAALYAQTCALCHGDKGQGSGEAIPLALFAAELKQGGAPPNVMLGFVHLATRSGDVPKHPVFAADKITDADLADISATIWEMPVPAAPAH